MWVSSRRPCRSESWHFSEVLVKEQKANWVSSASQLTTGFPAALHLLETSPHFQMFTDLQPYSHISSCWTSRLRDASAGSWEGRVPNPRSKTDTWADMGKAAPAALQGQRAVVGKWSRHGAGKVLRKPSFLESEYGSRGLTIGGEIYHLLYRCSVLQFEMKL